MSPWLRRGLFPTVLALAFLGFGIEYLVRTVLPLIVLARGGDAVLVGLLAGIFALPALVFRPLVGRLVDGMPPQRLLRAGTLAAAILPLFLLVPGTAAMLIVRFLQGTGWSFYSVANQALMARLAPRGRQGEASGVYMMMPAAATLVVPALGVVLFAATGEAGALLLAVGLGLVASLLAARLPHTLPAVTLAARAADQPGGRLARFVEPSALPGTVMLITFGSATTLFSVFAPVYAASIGIQATALALYFPIYGLAQAIALPLGGRLSDHLGRRRAIGLGAGIAIAGLLLAAGGGLVAFVAGAVVYAIASALVNPAISAMTIERAPRDRVGSAMATYSIGFQVANALSGLLWGVLITNFGFPWPFFVGIGLQLATLVLVRLVRRPGGKTREDLLAR